MLLFNHHFSLYYVFVFVFAFAFVFVVIVIVIVIGTTPPLEARLTALTTQASKSVY